MFVHAVFLLMAFYIVESANVEQRILSRNKRYLVFPEGSTLSIAVCLTSQTALTPGELYTQSVNWGIAYELPNDTKQFRDILNKPKESLQRRYRRDLYSKMETIMTSMGYNGRSCIQRALCEASRNLRPKGESLFDEILRIVFRYPESGFISNNLIREEASEGHNQYSGATQIGKQSQDECDELFSNCPFSLIDLALGYYTNFEYLDT